MKKLSILILSLCFFLVFKANATHIIGGEMNYTYLGSNNYLIKLTIYRDCLTGQAAYDNPASVGIFNASGILVQNLDIPFSGSTVVDPDINYYCGLVIPTNVCVETSTYTFQVNLPPIAGGYTLEYQRCCRNASILNIINPGTTGDTFIATIPDVSIFGNNSNPVFTNWPPVFICLGLPISINHSAIDADGDSLVYKLCTPFEGADDIFPMPEPTAFTPVIPLVWQSPYSENDMIGGSPALSINSTTGLLTGIPASLGRFVVGVCVEEYRNGVYMGETKRDFQFNVVDCQLSVVSAFGTPAVLCDQNVAFTNLSSGANYYHWDFGIDTLTNDTSNITNPSYEFPAPGTYTVTLIAYDNNCSDTLEIEIIVPDDFVADAGSDKYSCTSNGVQIGVADPSGDYTYSWTPTSGLNDPDISDPIANPSTTTTYIVVKSDSICSATDTVIVHAILDLEANFLSTFDPQCDGIHASFINTSQSEASINWLFSNGYNTIDSTFSYVFNYGDNTEIVLVAYVYSCSDTFKLNVPLFSDLITLPPPNIFTPNGDSYNDCYKLKTIQGFEDCYKMEIFNRWGKKVFEKNESNKCWDGKNQKNGKNLDDGVYFYVITIGEKIYNGTVTLIRK